MRRISWPLKNVTDYVSQLGSEIIGQSADYLVANSSGQYWLQCDDQNNWHLCTHTDSEDETIEGQFSDGNTYNEYSLDFETPPGFIGSRPKRKTE